MKNKKEKVIKKIEKNKNKLKELNVKKIGLFGSILKNKKKPSDIDILVEFENVNADNFFGLLFFLEKLFKTKVDLVDMNSIRKELKYVLGEAEYVQI